jgi:hypothetical protein
METTLKLARESGQRNQQKHRYWRPSEISDTSVCRRPQIPDQGPAMLRVGHAGKRLAHPGYQCLGMLQPSVEGRLVPDEVERSQCLRIGKTRYRRGGPAHDVFKMGTQVIAEWRWGRCVDHVTGVAEQELAPAHVDQPPGRRVDIRNRRVGRRRRRFMAGHTRTGRDDGDGQDDRTNDLHRGRITGQLRNIRDPIGAGRTRRQLPERPRSGRGYGNEFSLRFRDGRATLPPAP